MPYLSPESLPSEICTITLQIPNDELLRLAVMGQVYELTRPYLWEQYGAVTPAQAAAAMIATYNDAIYCEPPIVPTPDIAFQAQKPNVQTFTSATATLCTFPTILHNAGGYYNAANSRFTPLVAGRYGVWVNLVFGGTGNRMIFLRKNGVSSATAESGPAAGNERTNHTMYAEVDMDGIDDYLEVLCSRSAADISTLAGAGCWWGARLVYALPTP